MSCLESLKAFRTANSSRASSRSLLALYAMLVRTLRRSLPLLRCPMPSRCVSRVPKLRRCMSTELTPVGAHQVAAPSNLKTIRREFARVLGEDAADLETESDPNLTEYVRANRYAEAREGDGTCVLTRNIGDVAVKITFQTEHDDGEGEHADETNAPPNDIGASEEEKAESAADGAGEVAAAPKMSQHSFFVELRNESGAAGPLLVSCYADADGVLNIESLEFPSAEEVAAESSSVVAAGSPLALLPEDDMMDAADGDKIFFDDLSDDGQDKLLEFLDAVGVDDTLAQFVQHYAAQQRTQRFVQQIKRLRTFLHGADTVNA